MRRITFLFLVLVGVSVSSAKLFANNPYTHNSEAVIFMEGGVEFAVYPDGQFDFFYNPKRNGYNINVISPNVNISFNSGYNYEPYIQFDDFGAVIQIERVPVFYDYYGRIIQAGNVSLSYNSFGMLHRVGRMYLHYNPYRQYTHTTGFINRYNRRYVARPWHKYYMRPYSNAAVVYSQPYRSHYHPKRMGYNKYRKQIQKQKAIQRNFHRPGDKMNTLYRGTRTAEARNLPQKGTSNVRSNQTSSRSSSTATAVKSNTSSQRDIVREKRRETRNVTKPQENTRNTTLRRSSRVQSPSKASPRATKENMGRVRTESTTRTSTATRSSNRKENLSRSRSNTGNSTVRSTRSSKGGSNTTSRSSRGRN